MRVDITEFIASAEFGKLKIGMTHEEVFKETGEPAFFNRGEQLFEADVWVNGIATFWFSNSRLESIGLYFILDYDSNDNIVYEGFIPNTNTTEQEVLGFLNKQSISYSKTTGKYRAMGVKTEAGVVILFNHSKLNSIIHSEVL